MVRPRRALKRTWWPKPRWLQITAWLLGIALIALVTVYYLTLPPKAETVIVPIPEPQPTWTTYVPEMPWDCKYMLEAADVLYDMSTTREQEVLKIALLAAQGAREDSIAKLVEAGRQAERAEAGTAKMKKARENFLAKYRKCANA